MMFETIAWTPIKNRNHAEQANAWVARRQASSAHVLVTALSGTSLAVHAVPSGLCMFVLDWSGAEVLLAEAQGADGPYRFADVKSALVFLDALLMHAIARREEAERQPGDMSAQRTVQPR